MFLVVPQIYCVSDLKGKLRLINGKVLELIKISNLLLLKCFNFASGKIKIIWHSNLKHVNVLFHPFKVIKLKNTIAKSNSSIN